MTLLELHDQNLPATRPIWRKAERMPPAGPHARPELTNYDACPGAGALPSEQEMGGAVRSRRRLNGNRGREFREKSGPGVDCGA